MYQFDLTAQLALALVVGSQLLLVAAILFFRWHSRRYPHPDRATLLERQAVYFRIGLITALVWALIAMNYTTTTQAATFSMDLSVGEELVEIIPRLPPPPPPAVPPPPPPPPVIETVPDEVELDPVTFESSDIAFDEAVTVSAREPKTPPSPAVVPQAVPEPKAPLIIVERMPVFGNACKALDRNADRQACSDQALLTFIGKHIRYPNRELELGISGKVIVRFVVEQDGSISNIEALRTPSEGLAEEAIRVLQLINDRGLLWEPGNQQGKPVRVQFTMPVVFALDR